MNTFPPPIVHAAALERLTKQISLLHKIVTSLLWQGRNSFPSILLYEIATFLFPNPATLSLTAYQLALEPILIPHHKYLLAASPSTHSKHPTQACFITITKEWKPIVLSQDNYQEVITKGKFFLNFLHNLEVYLPLVSPPIPEPDPL